MLELTEFLSLFPGDADYFSSQHLLAVLRMILLHEWHAEVRRTEPIRSLSFVNLFRPQIDQSMQFDSDQSDYICMNTYQMTLGNHLTIHALEISRLDKNKCNWSGKPVYEGHGSSR